MFQFIVDVDATPQAHSFRVFLVGGAALGLIRILAWLLDRPLRSRTGAGYANDAQLAALGFGAMAANLAVRCGAVRVWWPVAFGQGLFGIVSVAAVDGARLHRTAHLPVAVALGSVFQAAFAGAAYLVAWPFLAWAAGVWFAYSWVTSPSALEDPEEEDERKRRDDLRRAEEEQASRWATEEVVRRQARNTQRHVGEWPF